MGGKSTLLRRIAEGRVPGWPLHLSVEMVQQEVLASEKTVKEWVTNAGTNSKNDGRKECLEKELADLENRMIEIANDGTDGEELEEISLLISELYEKLEEIEMKEQQNFKGDDELEAEKDAFQGLDHSSIEILKGLGFTDSMLD